MSAPNQKIYDELDAYFKGPSSKKVSNNLDGVSPDLQEVVNKATNYLGYSPKVTSGFRTQAEQDALDVPGKAKVSLHSFGQAIDQSIKGLDNNQISETLKYYNSQPGVEASVHNGNHIHVSYRPLKNDSKDYEPIYNELDQIFKSPSPNDLVKTISSHNDKISDIANQQKLLNTIKEQNDKITQSVNPARLIAKQIGNEQVKAINSDPQFKIPDLVQDNKIETIAPKRTLKKVESVSPQPKMKGLLKEKYDENPNVQQFFDEWLAAPKDLGETELIPPAVSRVIGKALTSGVAPFLPPEEISKKIGLDNLANVRGGVDTSLGKTIGGFTTPKNLAIAASMETPAAPYVLAGLTPGAVKGAYQSGDESINKFAEGDVKGGAEHLLDSILNAGMAVGGGIGAAKGLKIGSPKINTPIVDAPIPETPATLDLQIKALKEGRTNAALVTPGAKIPEVPKGMNIADTPAGVWIFNPKKISSVDIANSIKNGTHGELLGYVEPKSEATTATVVAKAPNGVEAKTALVSPENIDLQAKVLKDQFPDSKIEVGGLEKTQEILDKRKQDSTYLGSGFGGLQKFIEKTPEEISREQTLSRIKSESQKTGKKLVETMDDLEIPFDPQLYSDVMLAQRELAAKADKKSVLSNANDFYREAKAKLIDYNSPIEDLLASAQKKGKFEILPEYQYKNQVDRVLRSPTLAGQFVKSNGFDRIIKEVDNLNNLDQYMIAKHAIDVEGKGIKTGRDLLKDQQLVESFAPKYEQAAQKVGKYSRRLLDYSVDSGLVSKELASALKEKYPNYVPLNRVFSELEEMGQFHPKGVASLSKQSVVQKLEGSEREIQSPVQSLIEKTHDAFVQGERNKAGRILSEMKDLPGLEGLIKEVKEGEAGKHSFSFLDNGQKRIFKTTPEIAAAAKSLNVQQLNVLGRIFALPVRLAKTGITGLNIPFTASNLIRDQFTAFINTKNPMATMPFSKAFFESLLNAVKRGDLYKELVEQAAGGTSFDIARNAAPLTIDRFRAGRSLKDRVKYTVKHPSELLRAVEDIIGRSEEITRMQQYAGTKRANLKKGMSEQRAKISAAEAARENTANFSRTGEWGPVLNSAFLYLNASKEGTRAFIRGARRAPVQTAVKVGTAILFPQIVSTLWNLNTPERRKAYDDIPDYVKNTNLVYIPPNPTQDDKERWNVIKIPLEPGIGNLAIPARRIVEQMNGLDPVKFGEVANSVFSAFSPVDASAKSLLSTFTPQIIKPSIESYTNKNFFTDSPIVPPSLEKLSPQKQVKERTSGTARQIGSQLGVSPIKVEEFIKSTFGGVGQQGLNLVDRAQYAAGRIPKEQIGGQSILEGIESRFTKAAGGKIERDLYSDINKASQKQMDARHELKQQAKNILKSWALYSQENFEKNLQELEKSNPELAKKVSQLKEEQDGKIGPTDKAISALGIKNGVRAQFIYSHVKSMSQGEKTKFLEDLWNKKLLTNEVFNQMIKIKNNQSIGGEDE